MPGTFPVVGEVKAGRVADFEVKPGTVARITTGAPVPAGADAVIKVEVTELLAERDAEGRQLVKFNVGTAPGRCIRPVGSDIQPDQTVVTFVLHPQWDLSTHLAFLIYFFLRFFSFLLHNAQGQHDDWRG